MIFETLFTMQDTKTILHITNPHIYPKHHPAHKAVFDIHREAIMHIRQKIYRFQKYRGVYTSYVSYRDDTELSTTEITLLKNIVDTLLNPTSTRLIGALPSLSYMRALRTTLNDYELALRTKAPTNTPTPHNALWA